ncbi:hydrogenase maturation protease [Pseudarthrobacter sp. H3Y2-7]|jgi:hydrogenase maturation protease|uniref:hydrogenase maturation protease n=1 Tax=Pseudarthrobacter TaxID=1742993 RepID=UPI0023B1E82F|nr:MULTISPECIES: hydrogenase maturation protease [unclassified Pseudarthrobacter]MDE8669345.1 hydrogenase maturation protease [Pseudarthrobacter sp. H3Y2-7]
MTVLVAGVGNMFLRDDGFGPEVARRLASDVRLPPGVEVVDYGIRGMHLAYDLLAGVDVLVLVDAVPPGHRTDGDGSGSPVPGSLRVLRIRSGDLDGGASLDPHGMDPAAVLGKLRTLGGEVPETYVVGCVPADVTEGVGLTPPVAAALPGAVAAVVDLLSQHTSRPIPTPT